MANFLPVGSTKKFSYLISELLANIWSGDWRILKPNVPKFPQDSFVNNFSKDAILAFFELNPALRGYGYKDIHDTFRCFLNAIHDEHRILVPKPFELVKENNLHQSIILLLGTSTSFEYSKKTR